MIRHIERECTHVRRYTNQEPPQASRGKARRFFQILYALDDPRHDRKGDKKSVLYNDVQEFLAVANGDLVGSTLDHYCAKDRFGELCCSSAESCRERFTVAAVNLCTAVVTKLPMKVAGRTSFRHAAKR